jgi:hypothetical protein
MNKTHVCDDDDPFIHSKSSLILHRVAEKQLSFLINNLEYRSKLS